eukprot:TRINITY_DN1630_c0_g1_i5.p1 TRINITY_DN1630_c0_g1~~TRINITY_DN1630_c0_g1_i5.p1  ORF type:complete len:242 (-),score=26.78 TRINITY_DN1630_c0_g1_i5:278-1003(-)
MTLILGAVRRDFAIVGADGAEILFGADGTKRMHVERRQKLFPITDRPIVLAAHGSNTIHSDAHPKGVLLGVILDKLMPRLQAQPTVQAVAQSLIAELSPIIATSFVIIANSKIEHRGLKIIVIGFDGPAVAALEVEWMPHATGCTNAIKTFNLSNDLTVLHGGSGEPAAQRVLQKKGQGNYLNLYSKSGLPRMAQFLKQFYRDCIAEQPTADAEFGGEYHAVSVTPHGCKWQAAPRTFAEE